MDTATEERKEEIVAAGERWKTVLRRDGRRARGSVRVMDEKGRAWIKSGNRSLFRRVGAVARNISSALGLNLGISRNDKKLQYSRSSQDLLFLYVFHFLVAEVHVHSSSSVPTSRACAR